MSTLRRSIIHAALEAGDHLLVEGLMAGKCSFRTLCLYASHYGV